MHLEDFMGMDNFDTTEVHTNVRILFYVIRNVNTHLEDVDP